MALQRTYVLPKLPQLSTTGPLIFLVLAVLVGLAFQSTEAVKTFSLVFVSLVLEAVPFILIGALLSGWIEVGVSSDQIARLLPAKGLPSILLGAGLGLFFPTCECAIVPVVRRFLKKGVPLGAAIAYLLGGPIVNLIVAASTAVAYRFYWPVVAIRLLAGYGIAVLVGWILEQLLDKKQALLPAALAALDQTTGSSCSISRPGGRVAKLGQIVQHAAEDFVDIGRYFIIGAFLAAFLQTFFIRQTLLFTNLGSPLLAILMMMLLALSLNLCSEADAFVAVSFQSAALPLSAQMAFMVLGPMLDLKLLTMYLGVFRPRAILLLTSITFSTVLAAMILLEFILP